jgi:DNA polymerase III sliding clamp (beta) subunit (PCNA family)
VAPSKGAAYDKAAGIVIQGFYQPSPRVQVRATDLECTYLQRVDALNMSGDPQRWRFNSTVLAGVLAGMPMGSGSQVTLLDLPDTGQVKISSGKVRAKLTLLRGDFPDMQPFDETGMDTVQEFGARVEQVSWCTDPKSHILQGIHIDGTDLIACDRQSAVIVPCKVPVDAPVTAPLSALTGLIKNAGDIGLRASHNKLQLLVDQDTQITSTLLVEEYPDVRRVMRDDFAHEITVVREAFLEAIERLLVMVKGDRYPLVKLGFMPGRLGIVVEDGENGRMENEIEVVGGPADLLVICFTPAYLLNSVGQSRASRVTIKFGPGNDRSLSVQAQDYRADVMPRVKGPATNA